uniref:Transmembrane protein 88B n=1 Tax=Terrapene triunguis TaxID=2587831 RepID=A0A674KD85_9SAUR
MSDQEIEDFEVDNLSDTSRMIPGLPPYDMDDQLLPLEPRSTCCCWAWTLLIVATNSLVFLVNLLLVVTIFAVVLLPTIVVVYFGFQCHSRVSERGPAPVWALAPRPRTGASALIILGFVIMSPLIVVAMAVYCSLARRLRLFLLHPPLAPAKSPSGVLVGIGSQVLRDRGMSWVWNEPLSCSCT